MKNKLPGIILVAEIMAIAMLHSIKLNREGEIKQTAVLPVYTISKPDSSVYVYPIALVYQCAYLSSNW